MLLGGAGGSFFVDGGFTTGDAPSALVAGNFDPGADPDLAVANAGRDNVSVLLGGTGTSFGAKTDFAADSEPRSVAVGKFNPGSDPDLAVASLGNDNVSVLLGGAGGSFGAATNFAVGALPISVAVADFNADSNDDIVVANQASLHVSVLIADLIRNPAAEADAGSDDGLDDVDLSNWSETGGSTAVLYGAPGFPTLAQRTALGGGSNFFAGGTVGTSTATQNVNMAAELRRDRRGRGDREPERPSGRLRRPGRPRKRHRVLPRCRRRDPEQLQDRAGDCRQRGNVTSLLYRSRTRAVPVGTRRIRVRQTFKAFTGGYNDGYSDNLTLSLSGI